MAGWLVLKSWPWQAMDMSYNVDMRSANPMMKKAVILLLSSVMTIGVLAGTTPVRQDPDLSSPAATLRSFVAAFTKPDFDLAARHVKDIKVSPEAKQWEAMLREAKLDVKVLDISTSEGPAKTVLATCKLSLGDKTGRSQTETSTISLQQIGEDWLILQPGTSLEMNRDPIQSFVILLGSPSALFANAKQAAKRTTCMSNLKQVAVAAIMFAADNNDVLRFNAGNMNKKLLPYLKNDRMFVCPNHSGTTPSYSFNAALAGKSTAMVSKPAETVMFYEGSGGKLDFSRHDGTAIVAYCDGHVKAIKKGNEKTLRWKL
ncbi:MAG: hypothetical protein HONBIEJF_00533 [Fimbriimonadaceae bacterium]|nr:hypothetical protein [Fimbriimonadaceae bacterium]